MGVFPKWIICLIGLISLQACRHPLAIVGEGDIVDAINSGHGCTLEQFRARDKACTENEVSGDYFVNYKAVPRPGWRFVRWDGPCPPDSDFQHCGFKVSKAAVDWWDETYPGTGIPPSTAIFQPITGDTGYLMAGTPVAGVTYKTATQQGVTGLDGSFQYEEGETVRFSVGDTLLGEVKGKAKVTPFDLADSPVLTGINITWALVGEPWDRGDYEGDPFPNLFITDTLVEVNPFHTVINIAVFLQSLDHDAAPDNGIEIRQSIAGLFQGINLELTQEWTSFGYEPALLHAIWKANKTNRFSKPHSLVNPAPAIQHLYESLRVNTLTYAISVENWDWESYRNESSSYQFDSNGYLLRSESDWDDNRSLDEISGYEYDPQGNLKREEVRSDTIEPALQVVSSHYGMNGEQPRVEWDWDGNGTVDYIESWQYNPLGDSTQLKEWDEDGDGQRESRSRVRRYYAKGNLARVNWDFDADGLPERIDRYAYNRHGRMTRHAESGGLDATPGLIETWEYDARGRCTRYESDRVGDADEPVFTETWRYDGGGNVTMHETDEDGDGNPTFFESYEYDAKGNLTKAELHDNGEGSGDVGDIVRWQLEYDADNKLIRYEIRSSNAPFLQLSESGQYQYDASGNLVQVEGDGNGDGRLDVIVKYRYDTTGNLICIEEDYGPLGPDYEVDASESWLYDQEGDLARYQNDDDGDGSPELIRFYKATGWGHYFFSSSKPPDPRPI